MPKILGKYPGKTIHRIGVGIGGFWITICTMNYFLGEASQKTINEEITREGKYLNFKND
tara:strand:+ start:97 stop:273 length:177 start_codon:yes stop_codon:yes gene_type:complete